MDWERMVEGNARRLQRILAALMAMAGLPIGESLSATSATGESPPVWGRWPAGQRGASRAEPLKIAAAAGTTDTPAGQRPPLSVSPTSPPQGGRSALTLPSRLHRAILRQLRPLESTTRRLIIIAARDLPVPELPPSRSRRQPEIDLTATHAAMRRLGLAVVVSPADIARIAAEKRAAERRAAARAARLPVLPLLDPRKRFGPRRRYVPPHAAPRILSFNGAVPHKLPPPPSPWDRIDATRLQRRLAGIGRALADLPGQAQRYVRCKARSDARRTGRGLLPRSPLRPGRAPGWRTRSKDEINEILADLQYFAREVLRAPDTS